jgi:XRE family aerobic/anaerobic benzoate catabolism transcriptional regulator
MAASARPAPAPESRRSALLRNLGNTVRELRGSQNLSRQQLADRAGLSARFIAQLESGQGNISVAKLDELARALGVQLASMLEGSGGTPSSDDQPSLRAEVAALLSRAPAAALREALQLLRNGREGGPGQRPAAVIALIGLRGAGKSTVGPMLAQRLGIPFHEIDDLIQEASGLNQRELFELHGEGYYRQQEREALRKLVDQGQPVVVAVSGGIVTDPEAFRLLQRHTLTVWLKVARAEEYIERLIAQGDRRPMANRPHALVELRALLQARTPYYEAARLVLDTSATAPSAGAARLAAEVKALGVTA